MSCKPLKAFMATSTFLEDTYRMLIKIEIYLPWTPACELEGRIVRLGEVRSKDEIKILDRSKDEIEILEDNAQVWD
jgi:hypothetical protein